MVGIYKITSPSGKIYIGQSVNILSRINKYKNAKCITQPIILKSILKYGWESHLFEIVLECEKSELNEKERYYQELFNCIGKNGLNCMLTNTSTKTGESAAQSENNSSNNDDSEKTAEQNIDSEKSVSPTIVKGVVQGGGIGLATILGFFIILLLLDKFRVIEIKAFHRISVKNSKIHSTKRKKNIKSDK